MLVFVHYLLIVKLYLWIILTQQTFLPGPSTAVDESGDVTDDIAGVDPELRLDVLTLIAHLAKLPLSRMALSRLMVLRTLSEQLLPIMFRAASEHRLASEALADQATPDTCKLCWCHDNKHWFDRCLQMYSLHFPAQTFQC